MNKEFRSVNNPLTIIAIFAGIAEVNGTIVLAIVPPSIQAIFVWFIILFPAVLVIIFFSILIWKNNVLYAPSDFKNDDTYLQANQSARLSSYSTMIEDEGKNEQKDAPAEEVQRVKEEFNNLLEKVNEQSRLIQDKDELIDYAIQRADFFEMSYLAQALVPNSRKALLWFYYQPKHSSTKENFLGSFTLSSEITDPATEKEAIFNALIVNELLQVDQATILFTVSQKGERFLKRSKLLPE